MRVAPSELVVARSLPPGPNTASVTAPSCSANRCSRPPAPRVPGRRGMVHPARDELRPSGLNDAVVTPLAGSWWRSRPLGTAKIRARRSVSAGVAADRDQRPPSGLSDAALHRAVLSTARTSLPGRRPPEPGGAVLARRQRRACRRRLKAALVTAPPWRSVAIEGAGRDAPDRAAVAVLAGRQHERSVRAEARRVHRALVAAECAVGVPSARQIRAVPSSLAGQHQRPSGLKRRFVPARAREDRPLVGGDQRLSEDVFRLGRALQLVPTGCRARRLN